MPVTKTAKRALRSSKKKLEFNRRALTNIELALNRAKKNPTEANIKRVFSLVDRAAKRRLFHKNKAARIKSQVAKLAKSSKAKKA